MAREGFPYTARLHKFIKALCHAVGEESFSIMWERNSVFQVKHSPSLASLN